MIPPSPHPDEENRIKELLSYSILDTLPEEDYDNITELAASICGTDISLVSLIDEQRQWFKSHYGLDASETPKSQAFCAHAIHYPDDIFLVEDARKDARFHDNPLVTDSPYVIFYAGIPLLTPNGLPLGTLCVIDHEPKKLSQQQVSALRTLGKQVINLMELRKNKIELEIRVTQIEKLNKQLERFATVAAHDLKSPLNNIIGFTSYIIKDNKGISQEELKFQLNIINKSACKLQSLIDGLLEHAKSSRYTSEKREVIDLNQFFDDFKSVAKGGNKSVELHVSTETKTLYYNPTAFLQIMINLVGNAVKYNDKETCIIQVSVVANDRETKIIVADNGPGIEPKLHSKIFEIFETGVNEDKYGDKGNGIGLATVKQIIENHHGTIWIESVIGEGAKFIFTVPNSTEI